MVKGMKTKRAKWFIGFISAGLALERVIRLTLDFYRQYHRCKRDKIENKRMKAEIEVLNVLKTIRVVQVGHVQEQRHATDLGSE